MSEGKDLGATVNVAVFSASKVHVGELIVYPARLAQDERHTKTDILRVTRIEGRFVYGKREYPQSEGDRDIEFAVYPLQIEERGVLVGRKKDPR